MHDLAPLRRTHLCLRLSTYISLRAVLRLPELVLVGTFSTTDLRNFLMLDKIPWVPRQTPTTSSESNTSNRTVPQTEGRVGHHLLSPGGRDYAAHGHRRTELAGRAKTKPIQIIFRRQFRFRLRRQRPPFRRTLRHPQAGRCRRVQH
jgi:hypothetical protein